LPLFLAVAQVHDNDTDEVMDNPAEHKALDHVPTGGTGRVNLAGHAAGVR
jgi:hypothetical protein